MKKFLIVWCTVTAGDNLNIPINDINRVLAQLSQLGIYRKNPPQLKNVKRLHREAKSSQTFKNPTVKKTLNFN